MLISGQFGIHPSGFDLYKSRLFRPSVRTLCNSVVLRHKILEQPLETSENWLSTVGFIAQLATRNRALLKQEAATSRASARGRTVKWLLGYLSGVAAAGFGYDPLAGVHAAGLGPG